MELLFEARLEIRGIEGKLYFVQPKPIVHPEPVLEPDPDSLVDGGGVTVEGTVLKDGGILRMWYNAWPKDWDGQNVNLVGYAESTDGLNWRRPVLNLLEYGNRPNNLCNLGFCMPGVFIDPTAAASHRYRATGCVEPGTVSCGVRVERRGYYTAHSADGLFWELDSATAPWHSSDVITSIYHPGQARAIAMMKNNPRVLNVPRRSIWEASLRAGVWSTPFSALVPDEFDDICALSRGFASGDYYGMGMLAAGTGTVGFLWQFRHTLPRTPVRGYGVFGAVDITLAYQAREGDRWQHAPGRPDFISHGSAPWNAGAVYTATGPVEIGDEQWLYFGGWRRSHGWYVDEEWQVSAALRDQMVREGAIRIGVARWPKHRLFGFYADPEGILTLDLGTPAGPCELLLNYQAERGGSVRVALENMADYSLEQAVPLTGDALQGVVAWQGKGAITPLPGQRLVARIYLQQATLYAYEVRSI